MSRLSERDTLILPAGSIRSYNWPAREYVLMQGRNGNPIREADSAADMAAGNYTTINNFNEDTGGQGVSWPPVTKYYWCENDEVLEIKYGTV